MICFVTIYALYVMWFRHYCLNTKLLKRLQTIPTQKQEYSKLYHAASRTLSLRVVMSIAKSTYSLFLVEDHPLMRRVLRRVLEDEIDLSVIGVAASAEEALEQLTRLNPDPLNPDLVLSDLLLPGESGTALVSQLQKARPELRCVIISASDEPFYQSAALASGALDFVLKDDIDRLIEVVRQALEAQAAR